MAILGPRLIQQSNVGSQHTEASVFSMSPLGLYLEAQQQVSDQCAYIARYIYEQYAVKSLCLTWFTPFIFLRNKI